jgi:tetratricopeptide (TPR) repeat protein
VRYVWLAAALTLAGCASAPIKKQDVPTLAHADARVLDGCYDCFIEARDAYNRLAVGKARPLIIARLFETQLLIALREKELGLDSALAFGRARELANEMPPLAEAPRYLALANAVPPEPIGTPRRELQEFHRRQVPFVPTVAGELQWLRAATALREPVRQYLALSVDCGYIARPGRPGGVRTTGDVWTASLGRVDLVDAPPLVAYRAAMCDTLEPKALNRVYEATPEFVEAALYLGRIDVFQASETGGAKARQLFEIVRERFQDSLPLHYASGNLFQLAGNCRLAVEHYEKLIVRKPAHEDALLGRTACLSFLRRHDDALAQATQMIELRTDNARYAYYWRAWNHHVEKRLDPARVDIDRAKTLLGDEDTFTLAGIIEHDQEALEIADTDLTRAKTLDRARANCLARWYLGLVKMKQDRRLDSSTHFEDAMGCYDRRAVGTRIRLALIEARTDLEPEFKARQITGFQAAIEEDRSQQHAAAFNAANQAAQGGNAVRAKSLLEIAARDPALAEPVGQLREILKDR